MLFQLVPLDSFDPIVDTLALLLAAFGVFSAYQLPRMRIESSDEGIVIHNPLRTHRIRWEDIRSFDLESAVQVRKLYVKTRDGRRIAAEGIRAPLENAPFGDDRPALEIRDKLEAERRAARTRRD